MRQIVVTRRGGPEVLELLEVATPSPGPGEVRLKVAVAGVTFGDIIKREGAYPHQPRPPLVLGAEVAGTVDVVGPGVPDVPRGQRVATFCDFNGYADHLIIAADSLIPIPDAVSDAQAVALAANYLTAYQMIRRCARAEDGEEVLVHGAGGGVGTALLDLGAWKQFTMLGTASASKHSVVAEFGARAIDYRKEDFVEVVEREQGGVDIVFDAIGGQYWRRSLQCLRAGGRLVAYGLHAGFQGGRRRQLPILRAFLTMPRPSPLLLMDKNLGVLGYSAQNLWHLRRDWYREDMQKLMELTTQRTIAPRIQASFPLERASEAHRLLASADVTGKIILEVTTPAS